MEKCNGFTLIELLVAVAILISLTSIGVPSLAQFSIKLKVDNEISILHRMLLLARNHAVNTEQYVTLCPLNINNECTTDWHEPLTVFSDINKNKLFESSLGERIIQVKPAVTLGDKLQYGRGRDALIYSPSGHLAIWGGNATFKYCPQSHLDLSRGIVVSTAGRAYATTDNNQHGRDKNRSGNLVICN